MSTVKFDPKRLFFIVIALAFVAFAAACAPAATPAPTPAPAGGMSGMEMAAGPTVPAGMAYLDGQEITFIHTEVSDPDIAKVLTDMMNSPVLVVPALAQSPDSLLADVYVFTNGVSGMGPLGFQPDVFDNPPGADGYRPLRRLITVTWNDGASARLLKSLAEIKTAETTGEITLAQPGVVINMPFVTWPGGSR
jgi:hypothetical protein